MISMRPHAMSHWTLFSRKVVGDLFTKVSSYRRRTFCFTFCCETFIKTLIRWIHNGDNISWFSESVGWVRAELVTKMGEPPADPSVVLIRFPPVKTNPERQKNRIIIFYPNIPESHIMTFSGWRTTSNKIICQAARSWSSNIFVGSFCEFHLRNN